jgi:hypothetical protein
LDRRRVNRIAASSITGALFAGVLEFGIPALVKTGRSSGATASAVDTGFLFVMGAGIGIAIAAFASAYLMRGQQFSVRFGLGVLSGYIADLLGVVPAILVVEHFDILPILASIPAAAFLAIPFVLIGAGAGALLKRSAV